MEKKYSNFAQDLRIWRKEAGLTQTELAKKSGISYSSICKYETGERKPKEEQVYRLMDALGFERREKLKNMDEGLFDLTEDDLIFIKEEVDRIMENLSPKSAKKLYEYVLDLQRLEQINGVRK